MIKPLKILHVNTSPFGGAFTGAYRLHIALLKNGVSSKMLVCKNPKNHFLKEVYTYEKRNRAPNLINRISSRLGFPVTADQKHRAYIKRLKGDYEIISFPFSDYDITESLEYNEADIINLHWVGGFIDYNSFFKKNKKPLVWTVRDSNPFGGIFHLKNDLERNGKEWHDLNNRMIDIKRKALSSINYPVKIVGISDWIMNQSLSSDLLGKYKHCVIHNCININDFKQVDQISAKSDSEHRQGEVSF